MLPDGAGDLSGACRRQRQAIHFTKHALNNWLRLAGPSFDASLALEFLGFRLSDAREGIEAARAKRRPSFKGPSA